MKKIIKNNPEELGKIAYDIIKEVVENVENPVLGFATGSTPIPIYKEMIKGYESRDIDYSNVKKTFNLDEYVMFDLSDKNSYVSFMNENLFDKINISKDRINLPKGDSSNLDKECERYEELIKNNPIDLQILGIGSNGHIGFNEPGSSFESITSVVDLTKNTIKDNSRFYDGNMDLVPKKAISMGLKTIMGAKKIIIMITGKNKAEIAKRVIEGEISEDVPATILKNHSDVIWLLDKDAASLLK